LLAHLFDDAAAVHRCFFGQGWEESLHTTLEVHFDSIAKDLHEQLENIFEQNGGVVTKEVKNCRSILCKDIWDVLRVLLTNRPDHGYTLVTGGPVPLDMTV